MSSPPKDLLHHLSEPAKRRKANVYKLFYKFYSIPNLQDLSGGLPNPSLFPITEIKGTAPAPTAGGAPISYAASQDDIDTGLQYITVQGMPELDQWIKDVTKRGLEPCPYDGGYATLATCGSTDGWHKVLNVFTNEWKPYEPLEHREALLCEKFTYSCATEAARVRGLNVIGLELDNKGIVPSSFDKLMQEWDTTKGRKPHLLYTISIGQNPTGKTVPLERRKELYEICSKHDIIICEDEPYWHLQYNDTPEKCYLGLDVDGRVLRLDSFSKSFVPGARLGWITGQPELIRRIYYLTEEATQAPSGASQIMISNILTKWGVDGWFDWLNTLRTEYKERRDLMLEAIKPYAHYDGQRIIEYDDPDGGMFLWTKIRFDLHPLASSKRLQPLDFSRALWIWCTMDPGPALVNPGYMLSCDDDAANSYEYFRFSFAPSGKEEIAPATDCVGKSIHTFWQLDEDKLLQLSKEFPV